MGRRGPAPRPTALTQILGGKALTHRAESANEPKPRPVAPKVPAWLDKVAKAEWRRVEPELERLGLLTIVDGTALAGYCQAFSRWVAAEASLKKLKTLTYETPSGQIKPRPEIEISRQSLQLVKAFCAEFGLTPSARSRMNVKPPKGDEKKGLLDNLGKGRAS